MKHLEVRQKYSATRRIFNSLLRVSSGDETLRLMLTVADPDLQIRSQFGLKISGEGRPGPLPSIRHWLGILRHNLKHRLQYKNIALHQVIPSHLIT